MTVGSGQGWWRSVQEVRRAYGELAREYVERFGTTGDVEAADLELIVRHLARRRGVVLDVGCGPGHLTAHLRSSGVDAVGLDPVPEFLSHARAVDPDGRLVMGAAQHLPVADGSVHGLLAWYSLIHLEPDELDDVLVELRRVTVPQGRLVVGCFDGDEIAPFDHAVTTAYRWPIDVLATRLERAGFAEIERMTRSGVDLPGRRPHGAIVAIAV